MFGIDKSIIFFLKAIMFAIVATVLIPKESYRKYLIYGLFLGAGLDIVVILVLSGLGIIRYSNMGPFSIFGLFSFWTPIAWMFAFMIFLYFLPRKSSFLYAYIPIFSFYAVFVGKVLANFGLYRYNPFISFIVFLAWFSFSAWSYLRLEKIRLE